MPAEATDLLPVRISGGGGCCTPSKSALLSADVEQAAAGAFKALGHPIRLQILHLLGQATEPVCVCDLEQPFDVKQPTISHHLRLLREAGLVEGEQRGTWVYYRLRPGALSLLQDLLDRMGG